MALNFFLVTNYLSIEFVDQGVDGRIHVLVDRVGEYVGAGDMYRGFRLLYQFFHAEYDMHIADMIEMPLSRAIFSST